MESYDDRPISVYDNLSNMNTTMHTSTPKAKSQFPAASAASNSSYADISFQFNDNKKTQQQLLPNSNQSVSQSEQPSPSQVQAPNTAPYNTASLKPATTTTSMCISATAPNTSPAKRPLSQHSSSELNEASQSIAAVKAALNDAKSKFFGLNGYAPGSPDTSIESRPHELMPDSEESHSSNAPIVMQSQPKPQPKYQNIPENSAVFRNHPPELPPKPTERQQINLTENNIPKEWTSSTASSSPVSNRIPIHSPTQTPKMATTSPQQIQLPIISTNKLPYSSYKQIIPLNDIDSSLPSQAVYMTTTVPQNIKGTKIAGRHTPTRNSLRHSRMLVVNNKNYQGIQYPNPMNFKTPNLARWILILQIMVGLLISLMAIWIFFLAPSLGQSLKDNPYWSGLALLLAGVLGLVLVRFQRIKRHKVRENCFMFLRADSYLLSLVTMLLCFVALICASMHFIRLTANSTRCKSTNILLEHGSCSCTFNAYIEEPNANVSMGEEMQEGLEDRSYKVEYRDLSCQEVNTEWIYILGLSIALNSIGFFLSSIYIVLLACYRHNSKRFYTSVHTSTF